MFLRFPTAVALCLNLHRLAVRFKPLAVLQVTSSADELTARFLGSLNRYLLAAVAPTPVPAFQKLEVFTLVLPYLASGADSQPYQEGLARLGRMLTANTFPALRLVRLGAECDPAGPDSDGAAWQDAAGLFGPALRIWKGQGMDAEAAVLRADDWEAWCTRPPTAAA